MHDPLARLTERLEAFIATAASGPARAEQEAPFNALALEVFAAQYAAVPAYRALADHLGATPDTVRDWRALPAVPTAAFKEFDFTPLPVEQRCREFRTSGTTTGQPGRVFHNVATLNLYAASVRAWFGPHLAPEGAPTAGLSLQLFSLTPAPEAAPHSSLACMAGIVAGRFGAGPARYWSHVRADGAWVLDAGGLTAALQVAAGQGQPVCLLGTAYSWVHLLEHLAAAGLRLRLPSGSRLMETGGYKGRARELSRTTLHQALNDRLGVPDTHLVGEYGMCELASQAYDRICGQDQPRAYRFPPWARARVLSPETGQEVSEGEAGLLCVTDLANLHAVLAVQTEDLAVRRGAGFELLGRAAWSEARGCSLLAA